MIVLEIRRKGTTFYNRMPNWDSVSQAKAFGAVMANDGDRFRVLVDDVTVYYTNVRES